MKRPLTFAQAKAQFVHRYTAEHIPGWARKPAPNGKFYAPQFQTDREWYDATKFRQEVPGAAGLRKSALDRMDCYTTGQTWPRGQWLEQRI
jgi:hypothetical protein